MSSGNRSESRKRKRRAGRAASALLFEETTTALAHLDQKRNHVFQDSRNSDLESPDETALEGEELTQQDDADIVDDSPDDSSVSEVTIDSSTDNEGEMFLSSSDGENNQPSATGYTAQTETEVVKDFNLCHNNISPAVWTIIVNEKSEEESLRQTLAEWVVKFQTHRNASDELLHILRDHGHSTLPASTKSLVKTPRSTVDVVKSLAGGNYWYRGIRNALKASLTSDKMQCLQDDTIGVDIFIDGLSPHKSVRRHIWPIIGCLIGQKEPFVIALWCGSTKEPTSVKDFFQDFVDEATVLKANGCCLLEGKHFKFKIRRYIADAPARAWMKQTRPHTSYNACERCNLPGEWKFRRITFNPAHEGDLTTDVSFKEKTYQEHHIGDSPLLQLGTNCISEIPLEIMHMVYLGCSRRLVTLLLQKKRGKFKLPDEKVRVLDNLCLFLKNFCASDFARKPRPLSQYKLFKATEFRRLLLYDGFIIHKNHCHKEVNNCFLLLSCAMRILLDPELRSQYTDDAHTLLEQFVQVSYKELGASFVVFNVHHLLHLVADCKIHGDPEDFSAFKYENYLGSLKHLLVAPGRDLQQIICRLIERSLTLPSTVVPPSDEFRNAHTLGPVLDCTNGKQFAAVQMLGSVVHIATDTPRDSCLLTSSGHVVVVDNIVQCDSETFIIGRQFQEKKSYFMYPLPSALLNIYEISKLGPVQKWNKNEFIRKVVYYPLYVTPDQYDCYSWQEGRGLCIPLLHREV